MIEEELYSDSDHSSVYTSEDEFTIDRGLQNKFKQAYPLKSPTVSHKEDSNKDAAEAAMPLLTVQKLDS